MPERTFQPGFRLSTLDVVVLVVGGILATCAVAIDPWLGIAIAFVVLHFFLFCNLLRMSRPLELVWAGIFAALAVAAISLNLVAWPIVFGASSVVTVMVALIEMRRPSYHGVGWQTLNPQLPEWWQSAGRRGMTVIQGVTGARRLGWTAFDDGKSLGTTGSEGGTIRRDEEHDGGARITLEEGGSNAPWSITCGIYGWMFHTRFFGTEEQGHREFDEMRVGLEQVLGIVPLRDDATPAAMSAVTSAIEAFVKRFE